MTVLNLPDSLIAQLQDAPVLPASEKIKVLITHIDTGMTFSLSIGPGETIVRIHEWMHAFIDETSFLEWTVDRGIETMGLSDAEDDDSVLHVTGRVVYSDPLVDDQTPWLPCIKRNSRSSYGEKYVKKLKEAMHQGHQLVRSLCLLSLIVMLNLNLTDSIGCLFTNSVDFKRELSNVPNCFYKSPE